MSNKRATNKLTNSKHYKFILDCIEKDFNAAEIKRQLELKGMSVSFPTINNFIKKVRRDGINYTQFNNEAEKTALAINEKLKKLPELSSIFNRRNYLLDNLLTRRQKLIDYADEYDRVKVMIEGLDALEQMIKNNEVTKIKPTLETLRAFIRSNFKSSKPNPSIENLIRFYTNDIHEICKYVELWTSKYEINELLEKVCRDITKAAVESFGNYLKKESPVIREKIKENFINRVDGIIKEVKEYELKIGDKHEIK